MISPITGSARTAPPFRYDIVGSFLRSEGIKTARSLSEQGEITAAQLQEIEDREIAELLKQEKALGLKAVTDGEFRRSWWHLDFFLGITGTHKIILNQANGSAKENAQRAESFKITGKISFGDHPMLAHFTRLQQMAGDTMVKMTIPAPSLFHFVQDYNGNEIYPDRDQLFQDIITVYRAAIRAFYDAGCRYLQMDDTTWGTLSSGRHRAHLRSRGIDPDQLARDYVSLINESIADKPEDMTIALHVCRGNLRSTWFAAGGYEPVAETLFGGAQVDAFFLEYDNERSGDFAPLRYIKDQFVVLGLVTTKHGGLENKEQLKLRIAEAAEYVDIDKLCLSPQCGFASSEEGNILTEEEQWDKIRLVIETANEVWV
ncbi:MULTISPECIES: 5-methyltetrahydropteroyltriglutamate--homocysteine S-methyltransferase [unclassified Paenibacillus]|uniref:5-methyltetrahydropteroyltriglutamate-- homocysteine S-methyltransferase n=1 Tax=unclassified Paenibacillus TaxID=185978 RepID=UPI0024059B60|nr:MULTISPECIES: 5-methyltetrahydropteroyltriglutamate--homocysteine S-methyltransferase [unclassified Paenibacillus]MDF9839208.1 5-methyltetrahydropteroyltriglutamate--homocysteine methyltransferase [Paenibacillus sp. PastF-2]MDF9845789.1 5-methyltetrahydropteroyltriglutamate--homocysteine methyltransferase [Paenibacillus sp. PastM-2]MDF9852362.1 5-methyltetrahydropteroyltriglutamate--homocysteine methyltransferase [Paenibacillus sp. PastF-1]MDH6477908.1 5-methyltetrahydropteroyltriglutamate--